LLANSKLAKQSSNAGQMGYELPAGKYSFEVTDVK
jgi:hypothetical protein